MNETIWEIFKLHCAILSKNKQGYDLLKFIIYSEIEKVKAIH